MYTRKELAELTALAEAAIDGPWRLTVEAYGDEWWFGGDDEGQAIIKMGDTDDSAVMGLFRSEPDSSGREATAAFIAASREAVPRLIKQVERLENLLEQIREHEDGEPGCDWTVFTIDAYLNEAALNSRETP